MDEPRRRIARMIAGLDVHYDLGEGHPLLGRRMPDLDLQTVDGPTRTFALLHEARPVLLSFTGSDGFDVTPWAGRVRFVNASYDGVWEIPIVGEIARTAGRPHPTGPARRGGRSPRGPGVASGTRALVWPSRAGRAVTALRGRTASSISSRSMSSPSRLATSVASCRLSLQPRRCVDER